MLRFTGTVREGGRPLIGIGLSAANISRLREGKPILLKGEETNSPADVLIAYGDTEEELLAELHRVGFITKDTVRRVVPDDDGGRFAV